MAKKLISYIFPIHDESGNIKLLFETMKRIVGSNQAYDYEFIFINDGSSDDSLELLLDIQQRDSRVIVLDFARNYGHQIAVTAGLEHAQGAAVIIMDSDMQDPPSVSMELIKQWEAGCDVVYAQRRTRQDSYFKKATATLFYRLLQRVADIDIPRNTGDFRLIDTKVLSELKKFKEHNRFLRGMVSYVGFSQTAVMFDRDERHAGKSGYPLRKMLKFAADGIFGFSTAPLRLISRTGYSIAGASFLGALYALGVKIFNPAAAVSGWAFTVISVLFIGGMQLIMLGVVGSYVGRIYTEVQNRPLYGLRGVYSSKAPNRSKENNK